MLAHIKDIIKHAASRGYAVGAFNVHNLEVGLAVVRAAAKERSPVILQVSETSLAYGGFTTMVALLKALAESAERVPCVLHLDHGRNEEVLRECIRAGFSSVMYDTSSLPFEENIKAVEEMALFAHRRDAWIQGELGGIQGQEGMKDTPDLDPDLALTNPEEVEEFVRRTHVDALAIAVGTMHGYFQGKEHVDFERIRAIHRRVEVPLVLHGASGITALDIKRAINEGIRIINVDTEVRMAFTNALQKTFNRPIIKYDPRALLTPSLEAMQYVVGEKMKVFGSSFQVS